MEKCFFLTYFLIGEPEAGGIQGICRHTYFVATLDTQWDFLYTPTSKRAKNGNLITYPSQSIGVKGMGIPCRSPQKGGEREFYERTGLNSNGYGY